MKIQLIQGEFSNRDAMELITKMIHAKITYHENRIHAESSEEDMKYREGKKNNYRRNCMSFAQVLKAGVNQLRCMLP
jgi:hypothetical protein